MPLTDGLDLPAPTVAWSPPLKSSIVALKVSYPEGHGDTRAMRGIGYIARCECGTESGRCASWAMARGWLAEHRRACRS